VERVKISWPDGFVQQLESLDVDRVVVVRREASK
jgi:hypothetical protein